MQNSGADLRHGAVGGWIGPKKRNPSAPTKRTSSIHKEHIDERTTHLNLVSCHVVQLSLPSVLIVLACRNKENNWSLLF